MLRNRIKVRAESSWNVFLHFFIYSSLTAGDYSRLSELALDFPTALHLHASRFNSLVQE